MSEADLARDRALRDRAKLVLQQRAARVREDWDAVSLSRRAGRRIADGAAGLAEDAEALVRNNPGKLGALGAAIAIWLLREPLAGWLAEHLPDSWFDRIEQWSGGLTRPEDEE